MSTKPLQDIDNTVYKNRLFHARIRAMKLIKTILRSAAKAVGAVADDGDEILKKMRRGRKALDPKIVIGFNF